MSSSPVRGATSPCAIRARSVREATGNRCLGAARPGSKSPGQTLIDAEGQARKAAKSTFAS